MLCPKCGREYEGAKCPICDELDIIVNHDDYLKRRREYEEKQAALKSASSDNEENSKFDEGLRPDEILDKIVKVGGQAREKIANKATEKKKNKKNKKSRKVGMIIITISVIVVIIAVLGIYKLITNKDIAIYSVYDNKIYSISGMDIQLTCEYDEVIFEADKKSFYKKSLPQNLNDMIIKESMSSNNGKYYCALVYHNINNNYSVIIWNDENYTILAENKKEKKLLYIDNDGYVIYQETEVINEEGSVGNTQLYVSSVEKDHNITTTLLSEAVKDIYVYSDKKTIIFNELEGRLYTYVYGKNPEKILVDEEVTAVYGAVENTIHLFSYRAQQVNTLKDCNGFIYNINDAVYYYQFDFSDRKSIYLGKNNSTNLEYIIDQNAVIMISKNTLMSATIINKTIETYTEISKLGVSNNVIYDDNSKSIIFINDSNSLMYNSKGKIAIISDNVTDGTLNLVANTKGGFTYVSNNTQIYCKNVKASPVKLAEEGNLAKDLEIVYQKGKLYFINIQGQLYGCSDNGNQCNMIGKADRIILGK